MALEGNLEEFNIVAVLQTLAGGQLSGTLTVWDAVNRTKIAFVQGFIIQAESTLEADRFGEILVRTHRVTRAQMEKAVAIQLRQYPGKRLGQILLETHLITSADLDMAVQIQILEIMSRLLLWSRGRWHFQFDPPDPSNGIPTGAMTVDEILGGQVMLLDSLEPPYDSEEALPPPRPALVARPSRGPTAPLPTLVPAGFPPAPALDSTVVVSGDALDLIRQVLAVLLARTEGQEVCLIDSSGSLIAREGGEIHRNYPMLFALAASIFASWQELGRSVGESKTSTLLYEGSGLNICLTPVGSRAILMTLYRQMSNSGLVNFWSREASMRIGRVLDRGAVPASPAGTGWRVGAGRRDAGGRGDHADLSGDFKDEAARQVDDLFRE